MKTKKLISELRSIVSILVCILFMYGTLVLCDLQWWGILVIAGSCLLQKFFGDKNMIRKEGGC